MNSFAGLIGRVLLGGLFIAGALVKWKAFGATAQWLTDASVPVAPLLLAAAIGVELVGGTLLVLGLRARKTSWVLAVYLVFVTFVVHHDVRQQLNVIFSFMNLGLVGGLLVTAAHGAPQLGLDAYLGHHGHVDNVDAAAVLDH